MSNEIIMKNISIIISSIIIWIVLWVCLLTSIICLTGINAKLDKQYQNISVIMEQLRIDDITINK